MTSEIFSTQCSKKQLVEVGQNNNASFGIFDVYHRKVWQIMLKVSGFYFFIFIFQVGEQNLFQTFGNNCTLSIFNLAFFLLMLTTSFPACLHGHVKIQS